MVMMMTVPSTTPPPATKNLFSSLPPPAHLLPPSRSLASSPACPAVFIGSWGNRKRRWPRNSVVTAATTASSSKASSIHQDEDGNCVFGKKEYWDQMYDGGGGQQSEFTADNTNVASYPSDAYSWYCGWDELEPFWRMLVPNHKCHVVIAGIGNDPTPVGMYDAGWTTMTAYDYSKAGVDRAIELFGEDRRDGVTFLTADARDLPLETASVDSTLDKGTLDAIYITGKDIFLGSVEEMGRVTTEGGCVVSISRVIDPEELLGAFDNSMWENVHDGSLAFALDGEATIDLGAELYSWKRTAVPFSSEPL